MIQAPEVTGGAGFSFEDAGVAIFLTALLGEESGPGLSNRIVKRVALQQAAFGEPLDDAVVDAVGPDQVSGRLSLQIKRALTISAARSNEDFREIIVRAWQTVLKSNFREDIDRLGFVVGTIAEGPRRAFAEVCEWARDSATVEAFVARFETAGIAGADRRGAFEAVTTILAEAFPGSGNAACFRLFRHFVVIQFDLLHEGATDEAAAVERLRLRLGAEHAERAADLWSRLQTIARLGAGRSAEFTRPSLLRDLQGAFRLAAAPADGPPPIDATRLPHTACKKLRGREAELKRLDRAWGDPTIHVQSVIAWGGAGKTALVTEWVDRLKLKKDHGAEAILAWSFYSQGTKERATSSDRCLDWLTARLRLGDVGVGAAAKAEAIAAAIAARRILLIFDGVEPLQHGPGPRQGQLKDHGLRILLRRVADHGQGRGLILVTSRLGIMDIARWENTTAPTLALEKLSDTAGAALLKDRAVKGTGAQLRAAVRDFDGHALALTLLAGFLVKRQHGDVRRRDRIHAMATVDPVLDEPVHGHARRVLSSIDAEWFTTTPLHREILGLVGLFDRPASADCLAVLRAPPVIKGVTERYATVSPDRIAEVVHELREVGLLTEEDALAPDSLDAHPLVREWFGDALKQINEAGWREAHRRLYVHLRDKTQEGNSPELVALDPLFQAIPHGCRAGLHQEVFNEIYTKRLCRRRADGHLEYYAIHRLGATAELFAAITWLFEYPPFETPVRSLSAEAQSEVLREAAIALSNLGRLEEALPILRIALGRAADARDWHIAATDASNLSEIEYITGAISSAIASARRGVDFAVKSQNDSQTVVLTTDLANACTMAGETSYARDLFLEAEQLQKASEPNISWLNSLRGARYAWLLLDLGAYKEVLERGSYGLALSVKQGFSLTIGLDGLNLGCAMLGLALLARAGGTTATETADAIAARFDDAIANVRHSGITIYQPLGHVGRARFHRACGCFAEARRDLAEAEEIADAGPMRLYLCDIALERARLVLAEAEGFAPLADAPSPRTADPGKLFAIADHQLKLSRQIIGRCSYHRRDAECAELAAVIAGKRRLADLPPRVS